MGRLSRILRKEILQPFYKKGWTPYTATIGRFGSRIDGDRHQLTIMLFDIKAEEVSIWIDHCWVLRRRCWNGFGEGDRVYFRAKVLTYSGGYKLGRFREVGLISRAAKNADDLPVKQIKKKKT
jgi:hypothetical protein